MYSDQNVLSDAISVMLRYKLRAPDVKWKYKDECPMARVRKNEPVPIEVNGEPAAAILYEGMLTEIRINKELNMETTKEDTRKDASFFVAKKIADEWITKSYPKIIDKTTEAVSLGYESFSLTTDFSDEVNEYICTLLQKKHGYLGARLRRGKILVAVTRSALAEKPRRIRTRSRKPSEAPQKRPEAILSGIAVNYLAEHKTSLVELSERAKAHGDKTFSFKPLDLDRDAWWYLAKELKNHGFRDARVKKTKIVVLVETNVYDGILDDDELNNIF